MPCTRQDILQKQSSEIEHSCAIHTHNLLNTIYLLEQFEFIAKFKFNLLIDF